MEVYIIIVYIPRIDANNLEVTVRFPFSPISLISMCLDIVRIYLRLGNTCRYACTTCPVTEDGRQIPKCAEKELHPWSSRRIATCTATVHRQCVQLTPRNEPNDAAFGPSAGQITASQHLGILPLPPTNTIGTLTRFLSTYIELVRS